MQIGVCSLIFVSVPFVSARLPACSYVDRYVCCVRVGVAGLVDRERVDVLV